MSSSSRWTTAGDPTALTPCSNWRQPTGRARARASGGASCPGPWPHLVSPPRMPLPESPRCVITGAASGFPERRPRARARRTVGSPRPRRHRCPGGGGDGAARGRRRRAERPGLPLRRDEGARPRGARGVLRAAGEPGREQRGRRERRPHRRPSHRGLALDDRGRPLRRHQRLPRLRAVPAVAGARARPQRRVGGGARERAEDGGLQRREGGRDRALRDARRGARRQQGERDRRVSPRSSRRNLAKTGRFADEKTRAAGPDLIAKGKPARDVARATLESVDRGDLYAVPMADGRWGWRLKRIAPQAFARMTGRVGKRFFDT